MCGAYMTYFLVGQKSVLSGLFLSEGAEILRREVLISVCSSLHSVYLLNIRQDF